MGEGDGTGERRKERYERDREKDGGLGGERKYRGRRKKGDERGKYRGWGSEGRGTGVSSELKSTGAALSYIIRLPL